MSNEFTLHGFALPDDIEHALTSKPGFSRTKFFLELTEMRTKLQHILSLWFVDYKYSATLT